MVKDALALGIKPTARKWSISPNTVRKWVQRFQLESALLIDKGCRSTHSDIPCDYQLSHFVIR